MSKKDSVIKEALNKLDDTEAKVSAAPKPISTIEKVKIMNSLASAATNKELEAMIKSLEHGDLILELLNESIECKLKELMNEESTKNESLNKSSESLEKSMRDAEAFMKGLMNAPLFNTLTALSERLGGASRPAPTQNHSPQISRDSVEFVDELPGKAFL